MTLGIGKDQSSVIEEQDSASAKASIPHEVLGSVRASMQEELRQAAVVAYHLATAGIPLR